MREQLQQTANTMTLRQIQRVTGTLISSMEGVAEARLMVLELHQLRRWIAKEVRGDWVKELPVRQLPRDMVEAVRAEIDLWTRDYDEDQPELIEWNGKFVYADPPEALIFTDACSRAGGVWVEENDLHPRIDMIYPFVGDEIQEHITFQETAAAADGMIHVLKERDYRMCTVAMKVDATAAIKYMRCAGGKKLAFARRVWQSMREARDRRVYVGSNNDFERWHVDGKKNPADKPSRQGVGFSEWKLHESHFKRLQRRWGPFGIDAFAAAWNTQLPRYLCRQQWDRQAEGYDALLFPYQDETKVVWAFPPPHRDVTMKFLRRVEAATAEAAVVLPLTRSMQTSQALQMAVDVPVIMKCSATLLVEPEAFSTHAHMPEFESWTSERQWWTKKTWQALIGVRLSGDATKQEEFRDACKKQSIWSSSQPKMDRAADILIERSHAYWPTSDRKSMSSEPAFHMASQMWRSATLQRW